MKHFDVIIIGSGIAGMSLGSIISKERNVAIIEKEKNFVIIQLVDRLHFLLRAMAIKK